MFHSVLLQAPKNNNLNIFHSPFVPKDFQEQIEDENQVDISICINSILRKYLKPDYLKNSSTIFLNLLPNDETGSMMTQQRILKLLNEDLSHDVNLLIKDDTPPTEKEPRSREKAKNYLILVTFPTEVSIQCHLDLMTNSHFSAFVTFPDCREHQEAPKAQHLESRSTIYRGRNRAIRRPI